MYSAKSVFLNKDGSLSIGIKQFNRSDDETVKVSTLFTGINGTLRGIVQGTLRQVLSVRPPDNEDFLVLGFECVGEVEEVDSSNSSVRSGDIVVPVATTGDDCPNCRIGRYDNCSNGWKGKVTRGINGKHGYMRETFYEREQNLIKVSNRNIRDLAVLAEPIKDAVKTFETFGYLSKRSIFESHQGIYDDKNLLIIGSGSTAIYHALIGKTLGFNVYVSNRHELHRDVAKILEDLDIKFWNYKTTPSPFDKVDFLIDTAGDPETLVRFLGMVAPNGIVALFGTRNDAKPCELKAELITSLIEKNVLIYGSVDGSKAHYIKALEYIESWHYKYGSAFDSIITGRYPPEHKEIYYKKPPNEVKSVIAWKE